MRGGGGRGRPTVVYQGPALTPRQSLAPRSRGASAHRSVIAARKPLDLLPTSTPYGLPNSSNQHEVQTRVLRAATPLRLMAQDRAVGLIPLAAAHAATGLHSLLGVIAASQDAVAVWRPSPLRPANCRAARGALESAVANTDLLLDMLKSVGLQLSARGPVPCDEPVSEERGEGWLPFSAGCAGRAGPGRRRAGGGRPHRPVPRASAGAPAAPAAEWASMGEWAVVWRLRAAAARLVRVHAGRPGLCGRPVRSGAWSSRAGASRRRRPGRGRRGGKRSRATTSPAQGGWCRPNTCRSCVHHRRPRVGFPEPGFGRAFAVIERPGRDALGEQHVGDAGVRAHEPHVPHSGGGIVAVPGLPPFVGDQLALGLQRQAYAVVEDDVDVRGAGRGPESIAPAAPGRRWAVIPPSERGGAWRYSATELLP